MPESPDIQETPSLSGAGLLGLVTAGMYNDPLSMYREYIQNAADAAAGDGLPERARVEVTVDVTGRRIRIRDNGPGLSRREALERLLPIGRSAKRLGTDRGFRGVGRLAGLAFARTISFTTRAREDQSVTRITWHRDRLPALTSTESNLEQAVLDCVDVETLPGTEYPEHFFDVDVGDVARHSAGLLLNRDAVRDYVGEVCPVPLSTEFPFSERVEGLFDGGEAPLTLEVVLEGDSAPAERPHRQAIRLSNNTEVSFMEFQEIRIPSVDDGGEAAVGWIAHSPYLGAIPREHRVRGIRARVGNVQIGGEAVFDHLFAEERFNRWCVGEMHILDPRVIPNARRDYFEPSPHLRHLENQLNPVFRDISMRCRRESRARNHTRRALSAIGKIEDLYGLARSGLLTSEHSAGLARQASREVEELRKRIGGGSLDNGTLERLGTAEEKLNNFSLETELQPFCGMRPSEIVIYKRVFGALANLVPSPGSARDLIEMVFAEASTVGQNGSDTDTDTDEGTVNDSQAGHVGAAAEVLDTQLESS